MTNSPWVTMWLAPRVTIRRLIDAEQRGRWTAVVALAALQQILLRAQQYHSTGATPFMTIAPAIFFGGVQLVYSILVGPFILAITGGWLGGDADPEDIREAVAWGLVPQAVTLVIWIPLFAAFGWSAFGPFPQPLSLFQAVATLPFLLVPVATLWSFALQVGGIAAVQRFSIARALLSQVIVALPLVALLLLSR